MMVKIIVLQQWYDASDAGMEEALQDRLAFRRFAGIRLEDTVPDHSTTSRFRKAVVKRELPSPLIPTPTSFRRRPESSRRASADPLLSP